MGEWVHGWMDGWREGKCVHRGKQACGIKGKPQVHHLVEGQP